MARPTGFASKATLLAAVLLTLTGAYPHEAQEPTGLLRKLGVTGVELSVTGVELSTSAPETGPPLRPGGTGAADDGRAHLSPAQKEAIADREIRHAGVEIRSTSPGGNVAAEDERAHLSPAQKEAIADREIRHAGVEIRSTEAVGRRLDGAKPQAIEKESVSQALSESASGPSASGTRRGLSLFWFPVGLAVVGSAGLVGFRWFTQPGETPAPLLSEAELPSADSLDDWYTS